MLRRCYGMANFFPSEIQQDARQLDAEAFARTFREPLVLVVRLPREGGLELLDALSKTLDGRQTASVRPVASMDFNTQVVSAQELRLLTGAARESRPRVSSIPPPSAGAPGDYVVRLRKRGDVDAAYADRVSVGRAVNKDLVLRHGSISKFHAWFQIDEVGEVSLTDAGSKNGTTLNGEALSPRMPVMVSDGDRIRFGSIDVLACAPGRLWRLCRR